MEGHFSQPQMAFGWRDGVLYQAYTCYNHEAVWTEWHKVPEIPPEDKVIE